MRIPFIAVAMITLSALAAHADPFVDARLQLSCPDAIAPTLLADGSVRYSYRHGDGDVTEINACLRTAMRNILADPYPINSDGTVGATRLQQQPDGTIVLE